MTFSGGQGLAGAVQQGAYPGFTNGAGQLPGLTNLPAGSPGVYPGYPNGAVQLPGLTNLPAGSPGVYPGYQNGAGQLAGPTNLPAGSLGVYPGYPSAQTGYPGYPGAAAQPGFAGAQSTSFVGVNIKGNGNTQDVGTSKIN